MSEEKKEYIADSFITAFHFKVAFMASSGTECECIEVDFQQVANLSAELQTEDVSCLGENAFTYHLPKPAKTKNLVLKKALTTASIDVGTPTQKSSPTQKLIKWAEDAIYKFEFRLYDVIVDLLDEKGQSVKEWRFFNAYPVKISYNDLNAMKSEIEIETLELTYLNAKF